MDIMNLINIQPSANLDNSVKNNPNNNKNNDKFSKVLSKQEVKENTQLNKNEYSKEESVNDIKSLPEDTKSKLKEIINKIKENNGDLEDINLEDMSLEELDNLLKAISMLLEMPKDILQTEFDFCLNLENSNEIVSNNIFNNVEQNMGNSIVEIEKNIYNNKTNEILEKLTDFQEILNKKVVQINNKTNDMTNIDNTKIVDLAESLVDLKNYISDLKSSKQKDTKVDIVDDSLSNESKEGLLIDEFELLNKKNLIEDSNKNDEDVLSSLLKSEDLKNNTVNNGLNNKINDQKVETNSKSDIIISEVKTDSIETIVVDKENRVIRTNTQKISIDTADTIKYMKNNNIENLTVSLSPKELGKLNISLIKDNSGVLDVKIEVFQKDSLNIIKSSIESIKEHLKVLNIETNNITVDVKNDNSNSFNNFSSEFDKGQEEHNRNNSQGRNNHRENNYEEEISVHKEVINNNVNILI